jgi:cysteine synthase A
MKANDMLATIGNTPHIRVNRLFAIAGASNEVWIKSESAYDTGERYLSIDGFLPA